MVVALLQKALRTKGFDGRIDGLEVDMNKGELIDAVAVRSGVTKTAAGEVLDALLEQIIATVAEGDKVVLAGFGTFESRDRAEREGHNPHSGEKMTIPAVKVPGFKAGKSFKDTVKGS